MYLGHSHVLTSKRWWELTTVEASAVFAFLRAQQGCSARDIPVFLPDTSPTVPALMLFPLTSRQVPFRLVTASLMPGAEVVVLCGPEPGLDEVVSQVGGGCRALTLTNAHSKCRSIGSLT